MCSIKSGTCDHSCPLIIFVEATCVNEIEQTRNGPVFKCCVLFELATENLHAWSLDLTLKQPMTGKGTISTDVVCAKFIKKFEIWCSLKL